MWYTNSNHFVLRLFVAVRSSIGMSDEFGSSQTLKYQTSYKGDLFSSDKAVFVSQHFPQRAQFVDIGFL